MRLYGIIQIQDFDFNNLAVVIISTDLEKIRKKFDSERDYYLGYIDLTDDLHATSTFIDGFSDNWKFNWKIWDGVETTYGFRNTRTGKFYLDDELVDEEYMSMEDELEEICKCVEYKNGIAIKEYFDEV